MTLRKHIIGAFCAWSAAAAGCSSTPPANVQESLARPTDMVNACFEVTHTLQSDGSVSSAALSRPMAYCHPAGRPDPNPDVRPSSSSPVVSVPFSLAFVPNTDRALMAVVNLNPGVSPPFVDLDRQAGLGMLPLGEMAEHAASSDDSCRVVTANRGTCDVSVVDAQQVANIAQAQASGAGAVSRVVPITGSGRPLGASPAEIAFVPQTADELQAAGDLCAARTWRVVVTFPGCDLVALMELPSGRILDSWTMTAGGTAVSRGAEPVCSAECAGEEEVDGGNAEVDGGATDGGAALGQAPLGVSALAIQPADTWLPTGAQGGSTKLYVGSMRDEAIAVFTIGDRALVPESPLVLHEGAKGVSRLRLSIDPYGAQLTSPAAGVESDVTGPVGDPRSWLHGTFVGHRGAYLYGLAADGSIRAIELMAGTECDLAVDVLDPIFSADPGRRRDPCFAVGAPGQPRRRFGAVGPGLRLPSLATDMSFQTYHLFGDNDLLVRQGNGSNAYPLGGAFGYIVTATGTTFVLNVDPVQRTQKTNQLNIAQGTPIEAVPLSNSLRDVNVVEYRSGLVPGDGPPRVEVQALTSIQESNAVLGVDEQPQLESVTTRDPKDDPRNFLSAQSSTQVFFPDRSTVTAQGWTVGWERALPGTARITGNFGSESGREVLDDPGAGFCRAGTLAGDFVVLTGCTEDANCGTGRRCFQSPAAPQSTGMCFDDSDQAFRAATLACDSLVASLKRYEIVNAGPSRLVLRPHVDELVRTPLDRCAADIDCNPPEFQDRPAGPNTLRYKCVSVDGVNRCVQPCDPSAIPTVETRCRSQRLCVPTARLGVTTSPDSAGLCADAPALAQGDQSAPGTVGVDQCLPELTPYEIRVGRSFLVTGTVTPMAQLTREEGGACKPMSGAAPLPVVRLPIEAPTCAPFVDPANGQSLDPANTLRILQAVTPNPDPCLYTVPRAGAASNAPEIKALFQNRQFRFVLRNLDKYFGDMQIRFDVYGGFRAQTVAAPLGVEFGTPVRIVTSPVEMTIGRALSDLNLQSVPAGYYDYRFAFVVDPVRVGRYSTQGQIQRIHGPFPTYETQNGDRNPNNFSAYPQQ